MSVKVFSGCFLCSAVGFAVALGTVYGAGRGDCPSLLNEFFVGKCIGLVVSIIGCALVLRIFKESKDSRIFAALGLTIGLLWVSLSKASELMIQVYGVGFEHAVFSVASADQWQSTLKVAEMYRSDPILKHKEFLAEAYKNFVWRVYPGRNVYTYILDDPRKTNDLHVVVFWRGLNFNPTVEIGQLGPDAPEPPPYIYRKDCPNNISILLLRDTE